MKTLRLRPLVPFQGGACFSFLLAVLATTAIHSGCFAMPSNSQFYDLQNAGLKSRTSASYLNWNWVLLNSQDASFDHVDFVTR